MKSTTGQFFFFNLIFLIYIYIYLLIFGKCQGLKLIKAALPIMCSRNAELKCVFRILIAPLRRSACVKENRYVEYVLAKKIHNGIHFPKK